MFWTSVPVSFCLGVVVSGCGDVLPDVDTLTVVVVEGKVDELVSVSGNWKYIKAVLGKILSIMVLNVWYVDFTGNIVLVFTLTI